MENACFSNGISFSFQVWLQKAEVQAESFHVNGIDLESVQDIYRKHQVINIIIFLSIYENYKSVYLTVKVELSFVNLSMFRNLS